MSVKQEAGAGQGRRPLWKYAVALFVCLLVISHAIRLLTDDPNPLRDDQSAFFPRSIDGGETLDATVRMAYASLEPDSFRFPDPPTLILLHGSPMASMSMMPLARTLSDSFRVIVPDLPGFGQSSLRISDYSIDAHAGYLIQMMDSLEIDKAHIVGYSMGGGVALQVYDRQPERIQSIVMLSAIGVQELELLGSYSLNHAVHGMQLAFLWCLQELFPHMGYMDDALLNTSYARNFFDTDQRPLRDILKQYGPPMLIMHGRDDMQVPLEAAVEHERIVPQSVLVTYEGGHGLVFNPGKAMVDDLASFIVSVEQGNAPLRVGAESARLARAEEPFDTSLIPQAEGLTLIVFMLLLAVATLFSEDATCISAGLLVAQGTIAFIPATFACLFGIVVGDSLLFFLGRYVSGPLLSKAPMRWVVSSEALENASEWLEKRGAAVIVASRFIPGSRVPTYVAAGSLGLSYWKFLFYFMVASIIWTPALVGLAVLFGDQLLSRFLAVYEGYALWVFIGFILLILGVMKVVVPLFSHQGRRMTVGFWKGIVQWEFWPLWAFYPPIVLYILYLGVRYRSFTLFTVANPGIDLGGVVGESKSEILCKLQAHREYVASFHTIEAGESVEARVQRVRAFMETNAETFPVVLKPDVGERGKDVVIARSETDIRTYFEAHAGPVIAQTYAPGREFGVFYYRYPDEPNGHIFSITDKQFPCLTGNGKHTLQRLILDDKRAVTMAKHYFKANHHHLFDIPSAGEVIQLVEIGTHSRGAVFYDGIAYKTHALEDIIDQISKGFDGFFFGRFDIRTPSVDAFKEGKDFKIVELNGVTSEATHIYDPSNSLWSAYRTLMRQWRIAFEIGDQNRKRGICPASMREFIASVSSREKSR